MTQEEKDLLLKDLCARLPYGVIMTNKKLRETHYPLNSNDLYDAMFDDNWDDVPYLRLKSSMTEEEQEEWFAVSNDGGWGVSESLIAECVDWLNEHHFDYRGLIEKGLAVEVTEENNPYKN